MLEFRDSALDRARGAAAAASQRRPRFACAALLVALSLGLLVGPPRAAADPLRVRGLVDRVQPAPTGADAPRDPVAANEAVVQGLAALGLAATTDLTPYLLDGRAEVRLVVIEALARLKAAGAVDALVELLDHTDVVTGEAAAAALGRVGGPEAASALRTIVRRQAPAPATPPVRRAAIRALPATGQSSGELLPFLLPLLDQYPAPEDTAAVVAALAAVGEPSALSSIEPLLEQPDRRSAALLNLGGFGLHAVPLLERDLAAHGAEYGAKRQIADAALRLDAAGVPLLERMLRASTTRELDLHILRGLRDLRDRAAADVVLREYLTHRDPEYVATAVAQLGEDRDAAAVPGLHSLLEHADLGVRLAAAHALGQIAAAESVNPLTFALTREVARRDAEDNAALRAEVLWALGEIHAEGTVPVLIGALDVPDQQQPAVEALVKSGPVAVRTLVLILKSGDEKRGPLAIDTILRIGRAAGKDVVGLLEHPTKSVRTAGLELTAAVGDETAVPVLTKLALDPKNPNRLDALRVLGVFYTPELRPVFQKLVQSGDIPLKKAALQAIWRHEDRDASEWMLETAEEGAEPELRSAAVWGAFFLGAPGASGLFQRMLEYERGPARDAATEALSFMGDPRLVPVFAKAVPDAPIEYQGTLRTALLRLVRFQGDPARPPDFLEWYDDREDRFPKPPGRGQDEGAAEGAGRVTLPDGGVLAYRATGDDDDPLVVALHDGPDGDSNLLRQGLRDLEDDYRFVTYDRRGRGRSRVEGAAEAWEGWTLERETADLEALRRHLKADRLSIVAHGFGANVAIQYGATYPERVDRIVLLNAPYPLAAALRGSDERIRARLAGPARETLSWLEGRAGYFPRGVYEERWGYYAFPAFFHDPDRANRFRPPAFDVLLRREVLARAAELNLEDAIVTIPRPLLVVLTDDDLHPADQQARWPRLASLVPGGGRVVTVKDAGHYVFLEQQDDTLDLVRDFLEGDD